MWKQLKIRLIQTDLSLKLNKRKTKKLNNFMYNKHKVKEKNTVQFYDIFLI